VHNTPVKGLETTKYMHTESTVAKVVRRWALDQRVVGSNPGQVTVFAFLGKMLNLDCPTPPRCINGYL
jgi:hypothetical protein